jgi:hypothetical protein
MRHVTPDQEWGVTAGTPSTVSVALKNGWLPVHSNYRDWSVNTVGYVKAGRTRYLAAILSSHNPTEAYGIATVEHVASLTWQELHMRERWVISDS